MTRYQLHLTDGRVITVQAPDDLIGQIRLQGAWIEARPNLYVNRDHIVSIEVVG